MRRNFLAMVGMVICILVVFNFSWSACPEAPVDLGNCDTLHVVPRPNTDTCITYYYPNAGDPYTQTICINNPGEKFPCFLYVNLLVTHDSNTFYWEGASKWIQDSISAMVIPLGWTRTNPSKYCSLSTYWNENTFTDDPEEEGYPYPRRIWRKFPALGSDSINFMDKLKWDSHEVYLSSDSELFSGVMVPPHIFISLIAGASRKKWFQERDTLLATLTFRIEDTMHICIDSTFYPTSNNLMFVRYDSPNYAPRNKMPLCIWVGPPRIQVVSPNGGDTLCVGSAKDITWLSEKFTDPVKIEYSTNGGQNWTGIVASTPNTGIYHWPNIPNTPSTDCRVKVSAAAGGVPSDSSDAPFTISAGSITVTYPIGGEFFVAGDSLSVTWNSACFTGSVDIQMSEDGGTHWNPIASGTENDGIYPTLISQSVSTNQGLIKVSDSVDGIPSDLSDGFFTVRNFTIKTKPETLVVSAGKDTSCKVILDSLFGFSSPCTLTVSEDSLPAHTTYNLDLPTAVPPDTAILTFHTQLSTPACTSHIIVTGAKISRAKNQLEHSTKVILIVTGPPADFSIDASPETLKVTKGDSTADTVYLNPIYGFSSPCTLSVAGLPTGAKGKFVPGIVTPPGSSILAINTYADSIAVGEYKPIITGRNGSLIHPDTVTFIVEPCTSITHFTFTKTDSSFTIIIDSAFLYQKGLEDCDEIAVFDSGLCVGACVYHHPDKASLILLAWKDTDGSPTLVRDGYIEGDPMYFKIWSKEQDIEKDARPHFPEGDSTFGPPGDTSFVWLEAPPSDFSIHVRPDTLQVPRGSSGKYKVTLTSINGFASNCTLTVAGYPNNGSTATFDNAVLVPTDSSTLTLNILANTPTDTFTLTITATEMGKGEGITHSQDVTLIVTLPSWSFMVDAFPDTRIISQGNSTTFKATIIPNQGFSAPCTLFVEGLPVTGTTHNFSPNPIPPNDTSTLTITTSLSTPPDTYDLVILAVANKKQKDTDSVELIIEQVTGVDEEGDQPNAPDRFALFQNHPNPFNPETEISYYLSQSCEVKLTIYNILGRRVKTLCEGYQNAGMRTLAWDGKDDQGKQLSSGIYFYRLQAGEFIQTRKMSLLK